MSVKNKELIQKINTAIANGNFDFFSDNLSEDATWKIIGISSIRGKNNIRKAMEMNELENIPVITVNNVIEKDNAVVVQSSGKATGKSGEAYNASYCDVYHLEDGKIKELTTYVIDTV